MPLLSMVVITSIGMVRAATVQGADFGVPDAVLGTLVLATLTGIPNAVAAIRLAVQGRGAAVVSETFNSNSPNLIAGAYVPTLFVAAVPLSALAGLRCGACLSAPCLRRSCSCAGRF